MIEVNNNDDEPPLALRCDLLIPNGLKNVSVDKQAVCLVNPQTFGADHASNQIADQKFAVKTSIINFRLETFYLPIAIDKDRLLCEKIFCIRISLHKV